MVTLPIDLDVQKKARILLEKWKEKIQDFNKLTDPRDIQRFVDTLLSPKDIQRFVELSFPHLSKWHQRILAEIIRQGTFSSVSVAREISIRRKIKKKEKFVLECFKGLQKKLRKTGCYPKLIFKPVDRQDLSAQERAYHGNARVYELGKEFPFLLVGQLVPLYNQLELAALLAPQLLATLELRYGGFVEPPQQGPAGPIPLLGETLILGTWFILVEKTKKTICMILKEASIFKEHPQLFNIFESASRKGVQIRVVITKNAGPEFKKRFREIGALYYVRPKDLEEKGFGNLRITIHDDEHVIHVEKTSKGERRVIYYRQKPNVPPLSSYKKAFGELVELSKKTR